MASFAPFPDLPRELQDLVWAAAIPPRRPRVFTVTPRCHAHISWLARLIHNTHDHQTTLHLPYGVDVPRSALAAAVNTLLRTCRRSRAVAQSVLRRYRRSHTPCPVTVHAFDGYPEHIVGQPPAVAAAATAAAASSGTSIVGTTSGSGPGGGRGRPYPFPRTVVDGAFDVLLLQPRGDDFVGRQNCGPDQQGVEGVRYVAVSMLRLLDRQERVTLASPYLRRAFPDLRVLYVYVSPALLSHCMGKDGWPLLPDENYDQSQTNAGAAPLSGAQQLEGEVEYPSRRQCFLKQMGTEDGGPGDRFVSATGSERTWVTVPADDLRRVTRGPVRRMIDFVGKGSDSFPNMLPRQVRIVTDLGYERAEPVCRRAERLHPPTYVPAREALSASFPDWERILAPSPAPGEAPQLMGVMPAPRAPNPFWEVGAQDRLSLKDEDVEMTGYDPVGSSIVAIETAPGRATGKRFSTKVEGLARGSIRLWMSCFSRGRVRKRKRHDP
jgi:hypothetical protein